MRSIHLSIISGIALALASCYQTKPFTIITSPQGADITINGVEIEGKTPLTTEIKQSKDLGIVASKDGYKVTSATVRTKTNRWLSVVWMKNDDRCKYIEQDSITLHMEPISTLREVKEEVLPIYELKPLKTEEIPKLKPLPEFKMN